MLSLREAATAARISLRQLYRMRARGFGPRVVLMDGCVRIPESSFREWVYRHTEPEPGRLPPAYRRAA